MSSHADTHGDGHDELGHILPFSTYRNVLIGLLVLTVLTVVVAKVDTFDFGTLNIVIAMIIASIKASIVALYFMHLKYEDKITWLYVFFPLLLLALMMGLIFIDNPLRRDDRPVEIHDPLAQQLEALQ
ncbi:MAG: cytochrome C oxidase subunit IV family protein [Bdellovibrionales bacterium]|nr:cytochrome C oxidase subunit IV family protein [Bdellovibrionales bacterium]